MESCRSYAFMDISHGLQSAIVEDFIKKFTIPFKLIIARTSELLLRHNFTIKYDHDEHNWVRKSESALYLLSDMFELKECPPPGGFVPAFQMCFLFIRICVRVCFGTILHYIWRCNSEPSQSKLPMKARLYFYTSGTMRFIWDVRN